MTIQRLLEGSSSIAHSESSFGYDMIVFLAIIAFLGIGIYCYKKWKSSERQLDLTQDVNCFKCKFLRSLSHGAICRSISLIFAKLLGFPGHESFAYMLERILYSIPSLVWMISYCIVILFFAQLYFTGVYKDSAERIKTISSYIPYFVWTIYIFLIINAINSANYEVFNSSCFYIIGTIYIISASGLFFFGLKLINLVTIPFFDPF
eukprot:TRINITY_DN2779_c0_g1_i9.p1 TRINITY_DN2779_c0_g1~~TRINITY_DN2779_c0_g1_i9.p1  ORF type:complete len:206 (+),score=27.81 TRINITY_DN2779_c0_g1_i9:111-728(+)